jgi:hypothetical protein
MAIAANLGGIAFPEARLALRIHRRRQESGKRQIRETVYAVASLDTHQASPAVLGGYVREHWGIENSSHRVRDVVFAEEASTVRQRAAGDGRFAEPGHRQAAAAGSGQHRQDHPRDPGRTRTHRLDLGITDSHSYRELEPTLPPAALTAAAVHSRPPQPACPQPPKKPSLFTDWAHGAGGPRAGARPPGAPGHPHMPIEISSKRAFHGLSSLRGVSS